MIPKTIWTMWLNDNPEIPAVNKECIETQKIPGYEHHLITLTDYYQFYNDPNIVGDGGYRYLQECIEAKHWVKASDYLRIFLLKEHGGIFLDADMRILPGKNFDALLNNRMFLSREVAGLWANSSLGSEPNHPLLVEYLHHVADNYRGSGELVFQPGIRAFDDVFWKKDLDALGVKVCPTEMFFPFNHLNGTTNITSETIVMHLYQKSWLPK